MTACVAGTQTRTIRREGGALRLLPLVAVIAFATLALAMGSAYEREASGLAYCNASGWGEYCAALMSQWLFLASAWGASAVLVSSLVGLEVHLTRRGRGLGVPPWPLVGYGLGLVALGIAGLWASGEAGYGRFPHAAADAIFLAYVTASLLLFALAFLDYRPRREPVAQWAVVLASVHGLAGLALAFVYAYAIVNPPVTST